MGNKATIQTTTVVILGNGRIYSEALRRAAKRYESIKFTRKLLEEGRKAPKFSDSPYFYGFAVCGGACIWIAGDRRRSTVRDGEL